MTGPQKVLLLVGVLALVGGIVFLTAGHSGPAPAPGVTYVPPTPAVSASQRLAVHVVGAVRAPGLYWLPAGSRVTDAIAAAGGMTGEASASSINLAAVLQDGEQVEVKAVAPVDAGFGSAVAARPPPTTAPAAAAPAQTPVRPAAAATPTAPTVSYPLNLNQVTPEQLQTLPGLGPELAQRIVYYRYEHGAFRSVDDLLAVPGIGPTRLAEIRPYLRP